MDPGLIEYEALLLHIFASLVKFRIFFIVIFASSVKFRILVWANRI